MLSNLEKRKEVQREANLLEEKFNKFHILFDSKQPQINSTAKTEEGCDFLLAQFRAMNQALDQIPIPKKGNHKRDNNLI